MKRFRIAGAAAVAALAGTAEAAIVTVNFGGTYDSGQPLAGQLFSGGFAYDDTAAPFSETDLFNDGTIDQRIYRNFLTSNFTITDPTGTSTVLRGDEQLQIDYFPTQTVFNLSGDSAGAGNVFNQFYLSTRDTSFARNGLPSSFPFLAPGMTGGFGSKSGQGTLAFVSALRAPTAPVPEPTTWAMMIVGFGLTGGAMRRRRALGLQAA